MTDRFSTLRRRLAQSLAERGLFYDPWIRAAFGRVQRHWFVPETVWTQREGRWRPVSRNDDPQLWGELVYHPTEPLVTQVDDGEVADDGSGLTATSSISSVGAVLNMLRSLDPRPTDRVLEIGTGTGYNTALLCERVGDRNVVSVEVDRALTLHAGNRLRAAGYLPETIHGDGELGVPDHGPYSRLISTASVRRVPAAWFGQLTGDGELVVPWLPNDRGLGLMWLRKKSDRRLEGWFHGLENFMVVRGQRQDRLDVPALWESTRERAEAVRAPLDMSDVDHHGEFALAVALPGVTCVRQSGKGWFIVTEDRESWVMVTENGTVEFGPRDLVSDVLAALEWWRYRGRPRYHDFGVTVTLDGDRTHHLVWHNTAEDPVPTY